MTFGPETFHARDGAHVFPSPQTGRFRDGGARVTAIQPAVVGWMTVFPGPAGATRPPVSTLSYRTGRMRANNALLGVGTDGSINVYNDGAQPLHFIIDITGYFR